MPDIYDSPELDRILDAVILKLEGHTDEDIARILGFALRTRTSKRRLAMGCRGREDEEAESDEYAEYWQFVSKVYSKSPVRS